MAQSNNGRKQTRKTASRSSGQRYSRARTSAKKAEEIDYSLRSELVVIAMVALTIFLFLCNFGVCGEFGSAVSGILFGFFGVTAYFAPLVALGAVLISVANFGSSAAQRKVVSGIILFFLIGVIAELCTNRPQVATNYDVAAIFNSAKAGKDGGGFFGGSLAYALYKHLSFAGTALVLLLVGIVSFVIFTEQSFVGGIRNGSRKLIEKTREDAANYREYAEKRREMVEKRRAEIKEEKRLAIEQKEDAKILRMEKNVRGVMLDTNITKEDVEEEKSDNIHIYGENNEEKQETYLFPMRKSSMTIFTRSCSISMR